MAGVVSEEEGESMHAKIGEGEDRFRRRVREMKVLVDVLKELQRKEGRWALAG